MRLPANFSRHFQRAVKPQNFHIIARFAPAHTATCRQVELLMTGAPAKARMG